MTSKSWRLPLLGSGLILLSQAFLLPSPVRDAVTGAWASGYALQLPRLYVLFAPFCGLADRLTILSYHQSLIFIIAVVIGLLGYLGIRRGSLAILGVLGFLSWVLLIPHPMAQLVALNPDTLLIDFHSHTSISHDGRKMFTAERNMAWHRAQGYQASFITDHNRIESSQKAKALSSGNWRQTDYRALEGEEISLYKTHLVLLGNHERIDNQPYDSDPKKIPLFIHDMHRKHYLVMASLPEYWWYHWVDSPLGTVDDFIRWGIDGFEIINSAPKALDFPPAYRRDIVRLCRTHNLVMTGISDNHGFGYATAVWNAIRIPGWRTMNPDQLETAVFKTIKTKGFDAVEILERARYNPEEFLGVLCSPFVDAGIYWRSLQMSEAISWVVWIWTFYFVIPRGRKRGIHGSPANGRRG